MVLVASLVGLGSVLVGYLLGRFLAPAVDAGRMTKLRREGFEYLRGMMDTLTFDLGRARRRLEAILEHKTSDPEPYFVLAALHRADGNVERAARIHQSLSVRPALPTRQRHRARAELVRDYLRLGRISAAEHEVEELLRQDRNSGEVLAVAADVYEVVGAWDKAAAVLGRWARRKEVDVTDRLAHVHATAASEMAQAGDVGAGRKVLRTAPRKPGTMARAHLAAARAELLAADQKPRQAVRSFAEALRNAPAMIDLLYPTLEAQLHRTGAVGDAEKLLRDLASVSAQDLSVRLVLARFLRRRDPEDAVRELRDVLETAPDDLQARCLLAEILLGRPDAGDDVRAGYAELVERLSAATDAWRCGECGSAHPSPAWRCTSCGAWDSVSYSLRANVKAPLGTHATGRQSTL